MTKVNVRSGWTVMSVGIGTPTSIPAVLALNSLQKSMDLTPRAPRAGPTGGVGAALPAPMSNRWEVTSEGCSESNTNTYDDLCSSFSCLRHGERESKFTGDGTKPILPLRRRSSRESELSRGPARARGVDGARFPRASRTTATALSLCLVLR